MGSRTWTASGVDADESDADGAAVKLEDDGIVGDSAKRIWRIFSAWNRKSAGSVYLMEGPRPAAPSLHVEHHRHTRAFPARDVREMAQAAVVEASPFRARMPTPIERMCPDETARRRGPVDHRRDADQNWSAPRMEPSLLVSSEYQTRLETESLMNRTLPSPRPMLTPPECRLRAWPPLL
jgi:hypothetical protein